MYWTATALWGLVMKKTNSSSQTGFADLFAIFVLNFWPSILILQVESERSPLKVNPLAPRTRTVSRLAAWAAREASIEFAETSPFSEEEKKEVAILVIVFCAKKKKRGGNWRLHGAKKRGTGATRHPRSAQKDEPFLQKSNSPSPRQTKQPNSPASRLFFSSCSRLCKK
jgi:hypothetical protein